MNKPRILKINLVFISAIAGIFWTTMQWNFEFHSVVPLLCNSAAIVTMIGALIFLNFEFRDGERSAAAALKFTSVVQNSGDFIAVSDLNRKLQYLNPAGYEILGLDPNAPKETFITREFYTPENNSRIVNEIIPGALKTGIWKGEFEYKNAKTGEAIPVLMNVFTLKDPITGDVIGYANVSRDIRDRKKLQRKLDRFFEVSLDMLGIADSRGYFVKLNPAFTEILGFTEVELCSRPATDFVHPDDIQSTVDQIERQSKGLAVLSFENRYRTKDGRYRWFSWKSMPDGEFTYGAARDITEEKEQRLLLEKLSEDAIAASRTKSEFLANMSHEIRTPLNGIIGMSALLAETPLNLEQTDYIKHVKGSADSLLAIVNDILDFSKVEAGKLELEELDFNLEELVAETAKMMQWSTMNKSLPFVISCDPNSSKMFRGDPGRIRQVLVNLIGNAVKFTKSGEISLSVELLNPQNESPPVSRFRFSIRDTGIGISDEAQRNLFTAFSQADSSTKRKFGGTGLGLSICKKLVEMMGGEIGLKSKENEGSTFWFTIPLMPSRIEGAKSKVPSLLQKTKFNEAKILIAEDNIVNQMVLLKMLERIGFQAQAVANGNEVLSILREKKFDLILMDCQMPELDGYETTAKIRASTSLSDVSIPIIAMTANAITGDKERCLNAGMNDYETKPININALAAIVEKWLHVG
jgi:PAS domain S-box-containing protein